MKKIKDNKRNKAETFYYQIARRSGFILIIAIIIVAVLSGVLGAFKNGEFKELTTL